MVEYFRGSARPSALPCRLLQITAALALFSVISSQCSFAQNGASRNHGNQAVLNIRVNIVPAVMAVPPPPEPYRPLTLGVSYNVSTIQPNVEVYKETRPYSAPVSSGVGPEGAVLETTTVVTR